MRRGDCRHNGTLDNCRLARQDSMLHSGQCGARIYAAFISKSAMHDVFAQKAGIMTLTRTPPVYLFQCGSALSPMISSSLIGNASHCPLWVKSGHATDSAVIRLCFADASLAAAFA